MEFYAHSIEGKPVDDWHRLEEYLKGTEGTVPDLRTERSRVVESGLSPAKRNARRNSDARSGLIWRGCGMIWGSIADI
jgi:hypothetical protein